MAPQFIGLFRRHYASAWLVLVVGLACSGWVGWELYSDALKVDEKRFEWETTQIAGMIEQDMERYEERLARLADHCAWFDEMPTAIWNFRASLMTDLQWNLPFVIHAVYCPKIAASEFEAHLERGRKSGGDKYAFNPQHRAGREFALPVWQSWSRSGFEPVQCGTDMAEASQWHPSLSESLGKVDWISPEVMHVRRKDGSLDAGFWFALALYAIDQDQPIPWLLRGERGEEQLNRHRAFRQSVAKGCLAVFMSANVMLDEYNNPEGARELHARLYASRKPVPGALLNSDSRPPANPRHHRVIVMRWYGRDWALELTSTPLFENESPRYRAWMTGSAGSGLTLLSSALVAVASRARSRQERMTEQIREARDALSAAQRERERLSRDLHDNAIQTLYAIQLRLGLTAKNFDAEPAHARREFAEVRAELDTVIGEIRSFIVAEEVRGEAVDLCGVLRAIAQRALAGTSARIDVECEPGVSGRLSGARAVQLANIAREALSNGLRHGKPERVQIALKGENGTACLEITDDGVGFEVKGPGRQGLGLTSMAKRAFEIGAELNIRSTPGRGTQVRVCMPISATITET